MGNCCQACDEADFKEYGERLFPSQESNCCGTLNFKCGVIFPGSSQRYTLCIGPDGRGHQKESTNRFLCLECKDQKNWCELCAEDLNFNDDWDALGAVAADQEETNDDLMGESDDEEKDDPSSSSSLHQRLLDMGFGSVRARKAFMQTGDDMDAALGWLEEHKDDVDLDYDVEAVIDPKSLGGQYFFFHICQYILGHVFLSMYFYPRIFVSVF